MELDTDVRSIHRSETWTAWPVSWTAVWVGTLTAIAVGLIIGLIGIAIGAHEAGARIARWNDVRFLTLIWSIAGAFFSFVAGGWVAARIAGIRRAETAILHGGIVWVLAIPLFLALGALGALGYFGGWYGGLAGTPAWGAAAAATGDRAAAVAARNMALASLTALLLGLVGSALGSWFGSGEPMTFTVARARRATARDRRDIAA